MEEATVMMITTEVEDTAMTITMVAGTMITMEAAMLQEATDTTGGLIREIPTATPWPN